MTSKKEKKKSFPWCVRFCMPGGMFRIQAGDFTCLVWEAWEIVSRRETHTQCVRFDSPDVHTVSYTQAWELSGKHRNFLLFRSKFMHLPSFSGCFGPFLTRFPQCFFIERHSHACLYYLHAAPHTSELYMHKLKISEYIH